MDKIERAHKYPYGIGEDTFTLTNPTEDISMPDNLTLVGEKRLRQLLLMEIELKAARAVVKRVKEVYSGRQIAVVDETWKDLLDSYDEVRK